MPAFAPMLARIIQCAVVAARFSRLVERDICCEQTSPLPDRWGGVPLLEAHAGGQIIGRLCFSPGINFSVIHLTRSYSLSFLFVSTYYFIV